jgi:hypothetical protein
VVNVVFQSLSNVLFDIYGTTINTHFEKIFWEVTFGTIAVLYLISYVAYINILQSIWSFKHTTSYECPILGFYVPLPVYIKNRELIRQKQAGTF